jgi:hypothetical protein
MLRRASVLDVHGVTADELGDRHGRGLGIERAGEDQGGLC